MNRDFAEMLAALSDAGGRVEKLAIFGQTVPVIGRSDLILSKRAVGREKDLADLVELERGGDTG